VARQASSVWAISSRGFTSVNSEKLLVLSDSRTLYTPLVSGVAWDVQDYLLQDVDRIEVIRGPGASLWGSNAVNGVINITTKSARDTQGLYYQTATGTDERASVAARYGGRIAGGGHYRVFGKYVNRGSTFSVTAPDSDDSRMGHAGFRADWETARADSATLQAEVYDGTIGQLAPSLSLANRQGPQPPLEIGVSGGHVLGRWQRTLEGGSNLQLRAYYDRTHRDDPTYHDDLHAVDLDLQHRFKRGNRHLINWGVNYHVTAARTAGKGIFAPVLDPNASRDHLVGAYAQDQIDIGKVRITLGTKLERNDFSGFEFQPNGRVAWSVAPAHTLWSAVSRAVRVPTRFERDIRIDATGPGANPSIQLVGNHAFDAEKLAAYEAGYRWRAARFLFIDLAGFHNRYSDLATVEIADQYLDPGNGHQVIVVSSENAMEGRATGIEALATFTPVPWWRLSTSSSSLNMSLTTRGLDVNKAQFLEGATPRHQLAIQSFMDLPRGFQVDARFRHLTAIRSLPPIQTGEGLDGYAELDIRLAWRGWKEVELSVTGQNLLHRRHIEFGPPNGRGEIERGVYGHVTWGF
jgi:iron complex outermembrane receptor protein